jgi:hypothetical protein
MVVAWTGCGTVWTEEKPKKEPRIPALSESDSILAILHHRNYQGAIMANEELAHIGGSNGCCAGSSRNFSISFRLLGGDRSFDVLLRCRYNSTD